MNLTSPALIDPDRTISIITADETPTVDRFSSLRERWTRSDAIPVSEDTIHAAAVLLDNLPQGTEPAHISPSSDGEVGLSWIKGPDRFEAMLDSDNRLVWITKIDGAFAPGSDVDVRSENDRRAFYTALSAFYGRG